MLIVFFYLSALDEVLFGYEPATFGSICATVIIICSLNHILKYVIPYTFGMTKKEFYAFLRYEDE